MKYYILYACNGTTLEKAEKVPTITEANKNYIDFVNECGKIIEVEETTLENEIGLYDIGGIK